MLPFEVFQDFLIFTINPADIKPEKKKWAGNTPLEDVATNQIDYLLDNEATFQLMIHFMVNRNIKPETLEKYNEVQRYFFNMIDRVIEGSGAKKDIRISSHAYFAALTGVVMVFRNYPGRDKEEIRRHMHRLGIMIAELFKTGMDENS